MIIITGASRGIGNFLLNKYLEENYDVIGIYNCTLPNIMIEKHCYKLDIRNYDSVRQFVDGEKEILKNVTLINCAGVNYNSFAHKSDIDLWKNVFDVNLFGTYNMIRNLLPLMREQNYGRIINLSSVVYKIPTPGVSAYASSKSALIGLTKSIASENALKGITINNVDLGYMNIGMGINDVPLEFKEYMLDKIPCRKFGSENDIYNTIQFIINTEYINGVNIDLSGGLV
jgi:NAD(P)-dependent dehydrogenase (short-subunit alcohol dehydrogenase family)